MQLHLQVSPEDFAKNWNAAQVIAGPQLALGANSPYFFGHQLWSETRIELFAQATDTRPDELKAQGVRPRVWFGERWITSIFDLFEENVRYFPSLLPELSDEDPVAELAEGRTPKLPELRLHNGTIYRWNRPVYDVVDGRPHLRVENRVLPAGPDRRRHDGQLGVLLRRAAHPVRRGPPAVDEDEFRCGTPELPRGGPARDGRPAVLAGPGRGDAGRTGAARPAADGARRSAQLGGRRRGVRPLPRRHRGSRQDGPQRLGVAGGDGAGAAGAGHGPARGAGRDAAAVLRADAQQRAGAHVGRRAVQSAHGYVSLRSPQPARRRTRPGRRPWCRHAARPAAPARPSRTAPAAPRRRW